eukprot:gene2285-19752_t
MPTIPARGSATTSNKHGRFELHPVQSQRSTSVEVIEVQSIVDRAGRALAAFDRRAVPPYSPVYPADGAVPPYSPVYPADGAVPPYSPVYPADG